jgi:hypothetical protein
MTKDEAWEMIDSALDHCYSETDVNAIKEALAQPEQGEPVAVAHRHEWFRTGEMKAGQMRCISCGTWGQEDRPQQRTWVGLTDEEVSTLWGEWKDAVCLDYKTWAEAIQAKLKELNT